MKKLFDDLKAKAKIVVMPAPALEPAKEAQPAAPAKN